MSASGAVRVTAALVNWITIDAVDRDEFESWYTFEHLPERIGVPGFIRARRFTAVDHTAESTYDYFTVYETADLHVLQSVPYLERLDHPTPRTTKMVGRFVQVRRSASALAVSVGAGISGRILVAESLGEGIFDASAYRGVLEALVGEGLIVSGRLYVAEPSVTAAKDATAEGTRATTSVEPSTAALILEVHADHGVADIEASQAWTMGLRTRFGSLRDYRMTFALESDDLLAGAE